MVSAALALTLLAPAQEDFAALFDKADGMIRRMYYARNSRQEEMEALLAKYKPVASSAKDRAGFTDAMDRMIDEFADSHFAFYPTHRQGYYGFDAIARGDKADEMPHVGAWFRPRPRDGGYTIHMVPEGLQADKAGLRKGDIVMTVDGRPFTPIESLASKVGQTVKLGVRRGSQPIEATVEVKRQNAIEMFLEASRKSARVIERDGKKFGYMRVWMLINDQFRNALHGQIAGRMRDTDGFILDLRDGFGGRPEGFADPFFRPDFELSWGQEPALMRQRFGYSKPLVVLINEGSRSAKEVLSYILQKSGRATLVGRTTAGAVLGTTPLRLNEWSYLEIPIVDLAIGGVRLEDRGVDPDVAIPEEFDANGQDLMLEAALKTLESKQPRS